MSQTLELKDVAPYRVTDAGALLKPSRIGEDKNPKSPSRSSQPRPFLKHVVRVLQFTILPLAVLAAWWFASAQEILPANILPSPAAVVTTAGDLWTSGDITENVGISLWRVARGAAIGLSLGLILGLALGFSTAAESWLGPAFRTIAQIPSIALIPLLMMLLGIDDKLKLFIMAKAAVIPLTLTNGAAIWPQQTVNSGTFFYVAGGTNYLRQTWVLDGTKLSGPGGNWIIDLPLESGIVPEPATAALLAGAIALIAFRSRR